MDITEKGLIAEAQKLDENSLRVKLVLFCAKSFFTGPIVALGISYISVSALGFVFELVTKDPAYKIQAIVTESLFIVSAGYLAAHQILLKKLTK